MLKEKYFLSKGKTVEMWTSRAINALKYFGKQSQRFSVNIVRLFAIVFAGTTVFNIEC